MRSRWLNQFHHIGSCSKFHELFRQFLLQDDIFRGLSCYQEVPVQDLCVAYPHKSHRFDWFVQELGLIIELHGAQHYRPVDFGGSGAATALAQYRRGLFRDHGKYVAAVTAGYSYVAIPWNFPAPLSREYLFSLLESSDE